MAGKKPRKPRQSGSETRRANALVRMDDELVAKARKLAALRGTTMSEMFVSILRPIIDREWTRTVRQLKEDEGKAIN